MRKIVLLAVLVALGRMVMAVARAARGLPVALGGRDTALRTAAASSPYGVDGRFANLAEPADAMQQGDTAAVPAAEVELRRGALALLLARRLVARDRPGHPTSPIPVVPGVPDGPAGAIAVTWFGHSSVLIEVDGRRVLADPMWSDRASPSPTIGPRRMHPVPAVLERLPPPDAVVISHDHYDHFDVASVRTLARHTAAPFVVPVGVGAHLRRWGVPDSRIVELDWDGETTVDGLTLVCTRARHFSGRSLARNTTQWSSWAVLGPEHRAYFGGDTGFTSAFAGAGERWGPFDLTLLPVGAFSPLWPDIHMTPEEAVRAHADLRGGLLVPIHWATFDLGFHTWSEPVERLVTAAGAHTRIAVPRPGERIDASATAEISQWWTPVAYPRKRR